jgi:hypothetical protein
LLYSGFDTSAGDPRKRTVAIVSLGRGI